MLLALTAEDRRRVLGEWSTGVELSEVPGIAELIRRGRSIPCVRTAIRFGDETRSYGELFGQLDRLTSSVTSHGALVDQLIRSTPLRGNQDAAGSAVHAVTAAVADRRAVAAEQRCGPIDPALRAADVRLLAAEWNAIDMAVELLAALADGATLIVATSAQLADPTALVELIESCRVTHVAATADTVSRIAAAATVLPTVRRWDVIGTTTAPGLSTRLVAVSATSVATVSYTAPVYAGAVARGPLDDTGRTRPIPGARALVLDESRMPVPPNVVGEVYVGGSALGAATAHRFVDDPFEPGALLFRTGDHASWTPDGWLVVAEPLRCAVA